MILFKRYSIGVALVAAMFCNISDSFAAPAEKERVAGGSSTGARPWMPHPNQFQQLTLTAQQRPKVDAILAKYNIVSLRQQIKSIVTQNQLPPPRQIADQMRQSGDIEGSSPPDDIAGSSNPAGKGAAKSSGGASKLSDQQLKAVKKLHPLRQQLRSNWQQAWFELKPLLTEAQIAQLKTTPLPRDRNTRSRGV